jgi:lipopolysaccharide export LptBFGC system permease protein LptF
MNAEKAIFDKEKGWAFYNVRKVIYDNNGQFQLKREHFPVLLFNKEEFPEDLKTIAESTKPTDDMPITVILEKIQNSEYYPESEVNKYKTIFNNRLAFPWACFIAVLLALPLAGKSHRTGVFSFVIYAIVTIILYQFAVEISVLLGKKGIINPIIAGFGPTMAMMGFVVYKAIKE